MHSYIWSGYHLCLPIARTCLLLLLSCYSVYSTIQPYVFKYLRLLMATTCSLMIYPFINVSFTLSTNISTAQQSHTRNWFPLPLFPFSSSPRPLNFVNRVRLCNRNRFKQPVSKCMCNEFVTLYIVRIYTHEVCVLWCRFSAYTKWEAPRFKSSHRIEYVLARQYLRREQKTCGS